MTNFCSETPRCAPRSVRGSGLPCRGRGQPAQSAALPPRLQVSFGNRRPADACPTTAQPSLILRAHRRAIAFYIGHMKATDLNGNHTSHRWASTAGAKVNNGRHWDLADTTSLDLQLQLGRHQRPVHPERFSKLDITTTVTNNSQLRHHRGWSCRVSPWCCIFPQPARPASVQPNYPSGRVQHHGPQRHHGGLGKRRPGGPPLHPDAGKPLYSGFWPAQSSGGVPYSPEISGTSPDGLATFQPHNDRPVSPGQNDRYTVSLRFAPSGTSSYPLAQDAYASWSAHYPALLNWTDRRAIGTVYLASSPQGGAANQPGGFPTNPRRYFNSSAVNVTSAAGLVAFQQQILKQAEAAAANARQMNAQGVITWDIEGEQYPQATSYVCEPDAIAQVAPEMEKPVSVPGSAFLGKKLDDAYFSILRQANLRVGVCLRPQHFTLNADGTAAQNYLQGSAIVAELTRKARFAHDRWGATLFYVDSTVDNTGAVLPAAIFQQLHTALPDSLFIPEETDSLHYAYTAPFKSFIDLGAVGTDPSVLFYYPHAFSAVLVNDADPAKLSAAEAQLVRQVRQGDILMAHVDYWQANNPTIVSIYQAAEKATSASPPASVPPTPDAPPAEASTPAPEPAPVSVPVSASIPTTPQLISIATPSIGESVSGLLVVQGVVNDALDAAGTHLMVDGYNLLNTRLTSGPYTFPLDTRTLSNGLHTLQLWGHDIGNNTLLSGTVSITVSN